MEFDSWSSSSRKGFLEFRFLTGPIISLSLSESPFSATTKSLSSSKSEELGGENDLNENKNILN